MSVAPVILDPAHSPAAALSHARPWTRRELFLLAACVAYLLAVATYCGSGRIFWEDEMLGWMLLRDPSWKHMLGSWLQGADGGGFSFYLLGRLWIHIFGPSAIAFRMISTTSFAAAFAICWSILRRFYNTGVVAFASLSIWMISPALVQHMTEGRFYGLLVAAVSAALWLTIRCYQRSTLTWQDYAAVFLVHGLLVTSHQLGVVYSGVVVCGMLTLDLLTSRWRPRLYLSAVATWLLLIPAFPAIEASARVGKPFFWTSQPSAYEFAILYTGFTPILAGLLLCTCGLAFWSVRRAGSVAVEFHKSFRSRRPIYVLSAALFVIPVLFFLVGEIGPALCISRYLQPVAIGTLFLLAEAATISQQYAPKSLRANASLILSAQAVFLLGLIAYDIGYRPQHTALLQDYTSSLTSVLPKGIPIVSEDAFSFTELIARQHDSPVRYIYLLDWPNSLAPQAPRLEVTQFHLMENWKKVGYFSGSIRYADEFLRDTPLFYALSFSNVTWNLFHTHTTTVDRLPQIGSNLHQRLAESGDYEVALYQVVSLGEVTVAVWRVCRLHSGCDELPSSRSLAPSPMKATDPQPAFQAARR